MEPFFLFRRDRLSTASLWRRAALESPEEAGASVTKRQDCVVYVVKYDRVQDWESTSASPTPARDTAIELRTND